MTKRSRTSRSQPKKPKPKPITQQAIGRRADIAAKQSQNGIAAAHRAHSATHNHRTPEWLAGQKRIHDSERADRERSGHANHIHTMHKGGDT